MAEFGAWLRSIIAKYWVLINLCLLLFISVRNPVVAYRVIYMSFFLMFVNTFQVRSKPVDVSSKLKLKHTFMRHQYFLRSRFPSGANCCTSSGC